MSQSKVEALNFALLNNASGTNSQKTDVTIQPSQCQQYKKALSFPQTHPCSLLYYLLVHVRSGSGDWKGSDLNNIKVTFKIPKPQ